MLIAKTQVFAALSAVLSVLGSASLAAGADLRAAMSAEAKADAATGAKSEADAKAKSEADAKAAAAPPTTETAAASTDTAAAEASAPAPAVTEPASASEPESAAVTLPAPPGDVARQPPEAFPSDPIRGIVGGSLWMTFHGQQWPMSPFRSDPPRTQLGFSGLVWVDTGYETVGSDHPAVQRVKYWLQQGRFVLRATPSYVKDQWFVQGQAELVANKDQTQTLAGVTAPKLPHLVDVDDLWIKAGRINKWDVQFGRFEAWEIYHLGMGLDLHTLEREGANDFGQQAPPPPAFYGVTHSYYRPSGVGNLAVHVYPRRFLRAELLGQLGNEAGLNTFSVRPAVILDLGMLKAKAAVEYQKGTWITGGSQQDLVAKGGGGAVQVVLDPRLEAGLSGAYSIVDQNDALGARNREASTTTYTVGGFANARLVGDVLAGVGLHYTRLDDLQKNQETGVVGERSHLQGFIALQTLVFDQLFIKVVAAYAKADFAPSVPSGPLPAPYSNDMLSGRVRLLYVF